MAVSMFPNQARRHVLLHISMTHSVKKCLNRVFTLLLYIFLYGFPRVMVDRSDPVMGMIGAASVSYTFLITL